MTPKIPDKLYILYYAFLCFIQEKIEKEGYFDGKIEFTLPQLADLIETIKGKIKIDKNVMNIIKDTVDNWILKGIENIIS